MNLTKKNAARNARRLIIEHGMRPMDAARTVADEVADGQTGKILEMHRDGFLAFAIFHAEQCTKYSDPIHEIGPGGGDQQGSETQGRHEAPARTKYDAFYAAPYDAFVSVPGPTGQSWDRVRIGDLDHDHLTRMARHCGKTAETWMEREKALLRLADRLDDGVTIRDIWEQLSEDQRKELIP